MKEKKTCTENSGEYWKINTENDKLMNNKSKNAVVAPQTWTKNKFQVRFRPWNKNKNTQH